MKRIAITAALIALAAGSLARAQNQAAFMDDDDEIDEPMQLIPQPNFMMNQVQFGNLNFANGPEEEPVYSGNVEQNVQQALSSARTPGMDNWAWCESVENRLVLIGSQALPVIEREIGQRKGFEQDALQVAAFRIENAPLDPRAAILAWAASHMTGSSKDVQIARVMGADFFALFPHHLFYTIESRDSHTRFVLALAADAKVQSISDDASLMKFMRAELEPTRTLAGREYIGTAAVILAMSRTNTVLQPSLVHCETAAASADAKLLVEGRRLETQVSFDARGRILSIASVQQSVAGQARPLPVAVPTGSVTPSAMPD